MLVAACWAETLFAQLQSKEKRPTREVLLACFVSRVALEALVVLFLVPSSRRAERSAFEERKPRVSSSPQEDRKPLWALSAHDRTASWRLIVLMISWSFARFSALEQLVGLFRALPPATAQLSTALEILWILALQTAAERRLDCSLSPGLAITSIIGLFSLCARQFGALQGLTLAFHATWLHAVVQAFFARLVADFGFLRAMLLQLGSHALVALALALSSNPDPDRNWSTMPWSVGVMWAWRGAALTPIFRHMSAEVGALCVVVGRVVRTSSSAALLWVLARAGGLVGATATFVVLPLALYSAWTVMFALASQRRDLPRYAAEHHGAGAPLDRFSTSRLWLRWLSLLILASCLSFITKDHTQPRATALSASESLPRQQGHWRIGLWSAAGNGNLGDNLMPSTWERHFRALPASASPWSSVEFFSISHKVCCYSFDDWRKIRAPTQNATRFAQYLAQRVDLLWIGGGGILGAPHNPWWNSDISWQEPLRSIPAVWAAFSASGEHEFTDRILALHEPHPPHVLWRPRDLGSAAYIGSILKRVPPETIPDPVLADNFTLPALIDDPWEGKPRPYRVCWMPRTTLDNEALPWIVEHVNPLRDLVLITEKKDLPIAQMLSDVRVQTDDSQSVFRAFQSCEVVISMRYHGCIIGLRALRPTVALAPKSELNVPISKIRFLMDEVGSPECFMPHTALDWDTVQRCADSHDRMRMWQSLKAIQARFQLALSDTVKIIAPHVTKKLTSVDTGQQK
jgi:hypothetical protein